MKNALLENYEIDPDFVLREIHDAFFILSKEYRFLYLNDKAEELIGRSRHEVVNESIYDLFTIGDNSVLAQILIRCMAGERRSMEDFFSPVLKRWFKVITHCTTNGIALIFSDVHEEKTAMDVIIKKEEQLEKILDTLPHIAFLAKPTGENIYLNTKGREYTNGQWDQGMPLNWKQFVHPDDFSRIINNWIKCSLVGSTFEGEYRLQNAKGEYRWHFGRAVPLKNQDGIVALWVGTASDIHRQKLAEEELKESEYFIYQLTESSPDLLTIYSIRHQKFSYVNQRIFTFLGYDLHEFADLSLDTLKEKIHPDDLDDFVRYHNEFSNATDTETREIEYRILNSNNEWRCLRVRGKSYDRDETGLVSHFIATTQDITEKKLSEERKKEILQLKTLIDKKEEFINIASHELKTPITSIKASLQILKRLIGTNIDEKTLMVFVGKTNQQINKLTQLIKDMIESSKVQEGNVALKLSKFDIQEVINQCITYSSNEDRFIIRNQVKDLVEADRHKIEQVLINFISNADKYSPKGKEVYISVVQEDQYLQLSVTDSGIGIPFEAQNKVFDKFYRVKDSTEISGVGLGLYITAEIIKQHKGTYGVISQEGKGSTFWFKIPMRQQ